MKRPRAGGNKLEDQKEDEYNWSLLNIVESSGRYEADESQGLIGHAKESGFNS